MKAVFLGTNGWYDTDTGNSICILIETKKASIILDAGNGIYKVDRYRAGDDGRDAYLLISHFHFDHIVGLHTLNKFNFPRGLTICGPAGSRAILNTIVNRPFTAPFADLPYKTAIYEMPGEKDKLGIKVDARPLVHADPTIGYRIEMDGKVISYCTDTGYCENAVELSRSADLLIAECAYKSGQSSEGWPHLNPETAAKIAREAGVKRLALVHFDARIYSTLEDRRESEAVARVLFPNTFAAQDDMVVDI